jgi:MFS family permease
MPSKSDQRRIVSTLFASQSLFSAAIIAAFTLNAIVAADLSGSESIAGLPLTLNTVARAALAYPAGWMFDRIGRRLGLSIGYLSGALAMLLAAWSVSQGSFAGFLVGMAFFGGSRAASEQARYVAAEIYPHSNQAKIIGIIVFAGTIGAIVGPLLVVPSSAFAERLGLAAASGPFLIAGVLLIVAAVVAFVLVRPDPLTLSQKLDQAQKALSNSGSEILTARPLRTIFRQPMALLAVAAMVVGQMVMVMLMVITPLHMNRNEFGTQAISLVIMAHTIGMFAFSGVTGWLIDRAGRLNLIVAGALTLIAACIVASLSSEIVVLALGLFLLGLGWNFCFIAGSALLSDQLTSPERGRAQGTGEMAVAIGAGVGSFSSGLIFAAGGYLALSVVGVGFSLILLLAVAWFIVPKKSARPLPAGHD